MNDSIQTPSARKRTQKFVVVGIVAIVFVVALVSAMMVESKKPVDVQPLSTPPTVKAITAPGTIDAKEAWIGQSAAQLKRVDEKGVVLEEQYKQLSETQRLMFDRLNKFEQASLQAQSSVPVTTPLMPSSGMKGAPLPVPTPNSGKLLPPPPPPPNSSQTAFAPGEEAETPTFKPSTVGIAMGEMGDDRKSDGKTAQKKNDDAGPQKVKNTITNYIPSGSFASAIILGGIDAPTGGNAQTNPQPVVLQIADSAILPNKFRFQVKECHVIGAGFGDLSSERANIRLESLSCILEDGTTIDVAIRGYITGEDGKAGIRGRVITKQGQVLGNALLAGIGAGIGQAFTQNATTTQVSTFGTTTQVPTPGQGFQAGMSTGVSKAMDRLANYYISLADKLFPVIEIDAGRKVDIVFTKGVSFETEVTSYKETTWADVAREARGEKNRSFSY